MASLHKVIDFITRESQCPSEKTFYMYQPPITLAY
jgi:hypothetical protein